MRKPPLVLKSLWSLGSNNRGLIKQDRQASGDPARCEEQVLELFLELGASDEQSNFPIYMQLVNRRTKKNLTDESTDLNLLLEMIFSHVKPANTQRRRQCPGVCSPLNLGYRQFSWSSLRFAASTKGSSPLANCFYKETTGSHIGQGDKNIRLKDCKSRRRSR